MTKQYIIIKIIERGGMRQRLELEPSEYGLIENILARTEDGMGSVQLVTCSEEEYNRVFFIKATPKLIHLKNDLGLSKATIRKSYENDGEHLPPNEHTERGFDIIKELLDRRTQSYTKEEIGHLVETYMSSHDLCVIDNYDDFSAIEIFQANEKYARYEKAIELLKQF